jgi:hypothetical protein
MKLKTLILQAVISIGILTTIAHAQTCLTTDKKFYVANSDTEGTAWIKGAYPDAPMYSDGTGQTFTFHTWYYYWDGDASGERDQAYADLNISTTSQSQEDKQVFLGLVPSYTADCDGTEVYGDSIDITQADFTVCEIKSTTMKSAPDGTDKGRETVGVCERVLLQIVPDCSVTVTWSTDGSGTILTPGQMTTLWKAPEAVNDSETLTATFNNGDTGEISFAIEAPSWETATKGVFIDPPAGTLGAGMELSIQVNPLYVSFGFIKIKELFCPASNPTGFYTKHTPPAHTTIVPDGVVVDDQNCYPDEASFYARCPRSEWEEGAYTWDIPVRWADSDSAPLSFTHDSIPNHIQFHHILDNSGTSVVTKLGCSHTNHP